MKARTLSPGGSRRSGGTSTSMTKHAAGFEMPGGVAEALDLLVLRGHVLDRVVDQIDERERTRPPPSR